MNPSGSIRADPNPIQVPHEDSHFGETTLSWIVGRRREIEVRVGSPDGPLLSRRTGSGSVKTGRWVRDGMVFYLQNASDGASATARDPLDSVVVRLQREGSPTETEIPPPIGRVQFGDLRRLKPISREWGFDRGLPIDRYYVEAFLARHCGEIRGRVLEVGDDTYTRKFGGEVVEVDVLNVREDVPGTTIVGDLADAPQIPSDSFDCIVFTQTLQLIYDVKSALRTLYRILKPGGVLLATCPGISQTYDPEWGNSWYWNFTALSSRRLFEEVFAAGNLEIGLYGNVLAATGFLQGLAAEELSAEELHHYDPGYEVSITIRAVKAAGQK